MRIRSFLFFSAVLLTSFSFQSKAQQGADDLAKMLEQEDKTAKHKKDYTTATFKATRILDGNSIENTGKGVLDFRIMHRFGELSTGASNFYGFDNAATKLALDYGITKWLMVGVGRSAYLKEYDAFTKVKILRQVKNGGMPLSLSYATGATLQGEDVQLAPDGSKYSVVDRMRFYHQILIARKFNDWLSLQLMPTLIHMNVVDSSKDANDIMAMGIGGRIKLSTRFALTGEYYYTLGNKLSGHDYQNGLSVGVDIETGGHVFQLVFTNATGLNEHSFVAQNTSKWSNGGIHFGFNISRVFTIVQPEEFKHTNNKSW
ncbi:MAG: DUF5777 family beta-barrel protein [Bacteroidota bacterium]